MLTDILDEMQRRPLRFCVIVLVAVLLPTWWLTGAWSALP